MRHHRRFDWAKFLFIGGLIVLIIAAIGIYAKSLSPCLLYTSPSPRDRTRSRMPSSA
ncbi:hypothetical protein AMBR_BLFENHAL_02245 [Lacticaseibacillus rhamnosus]|nr:hypothetical protein AMBR_BLFENHAL_02245 [Lacticaseibacillus rhamnosus]